MKDLQAPYITDAEIYGVDSGQSADVPLDECCAYCGEPMYRGQTVTVMRGESRSQVVIATPMGAERVDKPPEEKDKLKAADMLGKYYALYTEKSKVDADLSFDVHFDYGDDAE